jgi:hypothetical protein
MTDTCGLSAARGTWCSNLNGDRCGDDKAALVAEAVAVGKLYRAENEFSG